MLLRGSNTRGARGISPNRSRGSSRGRGSTSRGALNSSGTSPTEDSPDNFAAERLENAAKREHRGTYGATVSGRGGRGNPRGSFVNKQVRFANPIATDSNEENSSKSPSPAPSNPFAPATTSPPFGPSATMSSNPFANSKPEPAKNPFTLTSSSPNPFGAPSQPPQPSTTMSVFGKPSGPPATAQGVAQNPSVFGAPSNPSAATPQANGIYSTAFPKSSSSTPQMNPFGAPSSTQPSIFSTTPAGSPSFGPNPPGQTSTAATSKPSSSPFATNPFGEPSVAKPSAPSFNFGSPASGPATSKPPSSSSTTNPFGAPSVPNPPNLSRIASLPAFSFGTPISEQVSSKPSAPTNSSPFGTPTQFEAPVKVSPKLSAGANQPTTSSSKFNTNGLGSISKIGPKPASLSSSIPSATSGTLAKRMDEVLRQDHIVPPAWPTSTPGDPGQIAAVHAFWQTYKGYRAKVRRSLIRTGLLDDPDKPKKLSEAIDFKGTCEEMCPEFERITRIVDRDVQAAEKELAADGSMWPAPQRMVKALARSAAGQDAPLPMDVRSPAALRRTLDYLLNTILGEDGDLSAVHGFLWDRTRAIRRDFVFQSSMSQEEISDQIYCLERITRFHVIALHQMSREEVVAEDFSEQQEIEQLGKALLSLIHAYEDCQAQSIACDNEAEFRAYYVLFNSHNSGILETVQDWGWKFWGESDQIKIAVSLVETLQNIWDTRGPLKPHSATDIAQNGYSRFFSIIEDKKVSYTMACFAEIHFNGVRKSALKTILAAYRKQRDQTKDWTLTKLNSYLRFDDEECIIEFGEAYGLQFQEIDGETYLSIESEEPSDPFPPLKQRHSQCLVERKRGDRPLPAVIDATVYDEGEMEEEVSDEDSLFVKDTSAKVKGKSPVHSPPTTAVQSVSEESPPEALAATQISQKQPTSTLQTPSSVFNQSTPPTLGHNFFAPKPAKPPPSAQPETLQDASSIFSKATAQATPSVFAPTTQPQTKPTPSFSFLNSPLTQQSGGAIQSPSSLAPQPDAAGNPPNETPKSVFAPVASGTPPATSPKPSFLEEQSRSADFSRQSPKPQFSLGGHSVIPPPRPSEGEVRDSSKPSSNAAQQSSLPQPILGAGPICNPMSAPSSSSTPQALAPQFGLPPATLLPEKIAGGVVSTAPAQSSASDKRKAQFDNLARWVFAGNGGILDHFTEHYVEQFLRKAVGIYLKEEADRKAKEEEDQARTQADDFRYRSLAMRYGQRWREESHRLWMRRRGREARKARREMAESLRASKALQSANVVEDFRASASSSRRGSLESLLDETGVLDGIHDPTSEVRAIIQRKEPKATGKQEKSVRSKDSSASTTNSHKRSKSGNHLRRSLLSDPTYLHGGSRIHLMSKYDARDETRRQISGVQTDYFRLKARGISTLPNGTPLANSAAKDVLHQKRSFDGITKPATPDKSIPLPAARSVPAKPIIQSGVVWTSADSNEVIQAMKARARALLGEDPRHRKRSFDNDDDELFARAKRVREQMDEGKEWYSNQIDRETASRSVS